MKTIKIITNDDEEHYFDLCEVKKFEIIETAHIDITNAPIEQCVGEPATEPAVENQKVDTTYEDFIAELSKSATAIPPEVLKSINAKEYVVIPMKKSENDIPATIKCKEKV